MNPENKNLECRPESATSISTEVTTARGGNLPSVDQRASSNTQLPPLHISQSVPILFRRARSLDFVDMLDRSANLTAVLAMNGVTKVTSGTTQGFLQERSPWGHNSCLIVNPLPSNSGTILDDQNYCNNDQTKEGYYQEHSDSNHDADCEDCTTYENDGDIEDQATIQSQSTLNSSSFSTLSSKLNSSGHTSGTREDVAVFSGSEDSDACEMQAAPFSFAGFTGGARKSSRRRKRKNSKMQPCELVPSEASSMGDPLSRNNHQRCRHLPLVTKRLSSTTTLSTSASSSLSSVSARKRINSSSRSRLILSWIAFLAKILPAFWISFMLYISYMDYPSSAIFPIMNHLNILTYEAKSNHIPLPAPDHKLSVVLLNLSSSRIMKESSLLPTLLQHSSVQEVVILHLNPKSKFNFVHPKVVNIDAKKENDKMGLSVRYYFCQMAKSDWVLHVDDNIVFSETALNEMLYEFSKNTKRIVGRYGRNWDEQNDFNGYSSRNTSKETEVVLSKFMVMERDSCSDFFQYSHLIWEDIVLNNGEGRLWNGEDIFMSLVSNHVQGHDGEKVNYAMDWLDVSDVPKSIHDFSSIKFAISEGFLDHSMFNFSWWMSLLNRYRHYSYRGKLWKEARQRLQHSGPRVPHLGEGN